MVILVFDPHVKLIIPRNKTLLLDAQNTQDHGLALLWTRDMPRASQHFYEASQPCGAAAVSLPARAQHRTRHDHARACRSSHAAAQELLNDMRRSPGGEEIDEHKAQWILWQQTRHPSRAHGLRHGRWGPSRMSCSTAHLARKSASKGVPARPKAGSRGSTLPHGNGSHSVSTRGLHGGAKGQGWVRDPRAVRQGVPRAQP